MTKVMMGFVPNSDMSHGDVEDLVSAIPKIQSICLCIGTGTVVTLFAEYFREEVYKQYLQDMIHFKTKKEQKAFFKEHWGYFHETKDIYKLRFEEIAMFFGTYMNTDILDLEATLASQNQMEDVRSDLVDVQYRD